jgi:hypothetical protein
MGTCFLSSKTGIRTNEKGKCLTGFSGELVPLLNVIKKHIRGKVTISDTGTSILVSYS